MSGTKDRLKSDLLNESIAISVDEDDENDDTASTEGSTKEELIEEIYDDDVLAQEDDKSEPDYMPYGHKVRTNGRINDDYMRSKTTNNPKNHNGNEGESDSSEAGIFLLECPPQNQQLQTLQLTPSSCSSCDQDNSTKSNQINSGINVPAEKPAPTIAELTPSKIGRAHV